MSCKTARMVGLVGSLALVHMLPAHVCLADTIIISSTDPSLTPGIPADELELLDLGIDPGSFVFTGNTQYDFKGLENLQIISGSFNSVDNSIVVGTTQAVVTMGDVTMGDVTIGDVTIGDSFSSTSAPTSTTPEPGGLALCAAGLAFLMGLRLRPTAVPAPVFRKGPGTALQKAPRPG